MDYLTWKTPPAIKTLCDEISPRHPYISLLTPLLGCADLVDHERDWSAQITQVLLSEANVISFFRSSSSMQQSRHQRTPVVHTS